MKRCATCGWFWVPRPTHWWQIIRHLQRMVCCPFLDVYEEHPEIFLPH